MTEDFNAHQILPLLEKLCMSYPQSRTCDTHNLKWAGYEYGRTILNLLTCNRTNDQFPKGRILLQYIHKTSYVQEINAHQTIARA
jgi:hypothetical protein